MDTSCCLFYNLFCALKIWQWAIGHGVFSWAKIPVSVNVDRVGISSHYTGRVSTWHDIHLGSITFQFNKRIANPYNTNLKTRHSRTPLHFSFVISLLSVRLQWQRETSKDRLKIGPSLLISVLERNESSMAKIYNRQSDANSWMLSSYRFLPLMTLPREDKDWLMAEPSLRRSPVAPVESARSLRRTNEDKIVNHWRVMRKICCAPSSCG